MTVQERTYAVLTQMARMNVDVARDSLKMLMEYVRMSMSVLTQNSTTVTRTRCVKTLLDIKHVHVTKAWSVTDSSASVSTIGYRLCSQWGMLAMGPGAC